MKNILVKIFFAIVALIVVMAMVYLINEVLFSD